MFFNCSLSYSQVKEFKMPKALNSMDSFITVQKLYIYNTILDSIDRDFRRSKINNKFLINIDLRYDRYQSNVGYAGRFLQKETDIDDSSCLRQIKNLYRQKISDSILFFTSLGKPYSIREVLISSSFFKPILETNNNFYVEVNAPTEGWDALYLNSLCKYLDDLNKFDFYSTKYYSHKSERIYIPIYICNDKTNDNKEFRRLYIFTFTNINNKIQIKFDGFISI